MSFPVYVRVMRSRQPPVVFTACDGLSLSLYVCVCVCMCVYLSVCVSVQKLITNQNWCDLTVK